MKNSTQIIGLPIISITDGTEVGKVKTLVVNPDKGTVDFLTIDHEDWQVSVKAIPFKKIIGIGEYAVTVDNVGAVIDLNEIPIANQLVNKKIKIIHTKVMTRKGQLLGEVTEYYIDDDNGQIIGAAVKMKEEEAILPANTVLTFGRDFIIVGEETEQSFLTSPEELIGLGEKTEAQPETQAEAVEPSMEEDIEEALKGKQLQLLEGKKVKKDIHDRQGRLLFKEGMILNSGDVKKAQNEDPGVIVELSMSVEA